MSQDPPIDSRDDKLDQLYREGLSAASGDWHAHPAPPVPASSGGGIDRTVPMILAAVFAMLLVGALGAAAIGGVFSTSRVHPPTYAAGSHSGSGYRCPPDCGGAMASTGCVSDKFAASPVATACPSPNQELCSGSTVPASCLKGVTPGPKGSQPGPPVGRGCGPTASCMAPCRGAPSSPCPPATAPPGGDCTYTGAPTTVATDHASYTSGQVVLITVTVTNRGPKACTLPVDDSSMPCNPTAWASDHNTGAGTWYSRNPQIMTPCRVGNPTLLAPGQSISRSFKWDQSCNGRGGCAGIAPRGTYDIVGTWTGKQMIQVLLD
jgi:hypothetical protein